MRTSIPKKFLPNKNVYVGMAVEQSLHYCLSESKMPQLDCLEYGQPLGSNVCHPYIAMGQEFMRVNNVCFIVLGH